RLGFTNLRLHRVFAECHPDNVASARVMQRLGMTYEGRLREIEWAGGGWWDMLHYAILDHEWQDRERARSGDSPSRP
ncbi:MAG TPA: GNAT family protein, partial [Ktedonobacterales bacterium]|nr:GNAT family protein [Ktedonobacterales bacterium]